MLKGFMNHRMGPNRIEQPLALIMEKPIVHARRHIMWTFVRCPQICYVISMVRPTLNFCDYEIAIPNANNGVEWSLGDLEREFTHIRPLCSDKLRVEHHRNRVGLSGISGTMAHWYAMRVPYPSKLVSCSLG